MKWISVEEMLPEERDNVLWCTVPVCEPYYFGSILDSDFPENYYTHWLPFNVLPEPPKDNH